MKTILFAKNNATITIGDNTGISNSALVAVDSIAIGNNVLIGGNCKFMIMIFILWILMREWEL